MTEINGLRAVAATTGTLHAITPAPEREDYETEHEYRAAHEAWVARSHWTFKRDTPQGTPDTAGYADEHPARDKEHSS